MKFKMKGICYFLISFGCIVLSDAVLASASEYTGGIFSNEYSPHNHFEIIGAGGIAKLSGSNSELGVTSSESDKLVQTNRNDWNTGAGQLGIGYVFYFHDYTHQDPNQVQWFTSIAPQVNAYQLFSSSMKGNIWRYNDPNFNQLTYKIPFHSTRLMLDAALTVAQWKRISLYTKAGIGEAWNRASYSDTNNADVGCEEQQLSLSSHTNSNFVWEVGAGIGLALNNRFSLTAEYLYTDLGTVKTSSQGTTGTITTPVISAPHFNVRAQTGLLGLHIAI